MLARWLRHPALRRLRRSAPVARLAWWAQRWRARDPHYEAARRARFAARQNLYPLPPDAPRLSILTPVWNTDPAQLQALADSLLGQSDPPPFEWVIQDNASSRAETRALLDGIARHPAVRLARSDRNLGIIGGLRAALERATGDYVLTVDHDDWLYPDALRIVAWHLVEKGRPPLFYSDEDKLYGDRHCHPYFKPDWDPVLFGNAAYIAHLSGYDRERGLALGLYTDAAVEGCHDWDGFDRFRRAGAVPLHVPEVLYGWRMHPGSTAADAGAKSFIAASHRALLSRMRADLAVPEHFEIEPSPLFPGTPDWHWRRLPVAPRPVVTIGRGAHLEPWRAAAAHPDQRWVALPADAPAEALAEQARDAAAAGALVRLIGPGVAPLSQSDGDAMLWEAQGLIERFPDTAMVGGALVGPDGRLVAAGRFFGFGEGCDGPDLGTRRADPGYHARLWQQHSVDAVSGALAVIEPDFLAAALARAGRGPGAAGLIGLWCGIEAQQAGRRIVYSPFVAGRAAADPDADPAALRRALTRYRAVLRESGLRSPRLSRAAGSGWQPETAPGV